jgi:hypothetical protein
MEIYKRIDSFIREAYHSDKGVTTYIDEMNSKAGASWSILGWNETLEQLKNYRHIRNSYSHDVGSSYSDICTPEDIRWLQSFYSKLMSAQDPMSLYLKQKQEASKKVTRTYVRPVEAEKKEDNTISNHEEKRSQYTAPPKKSKGGCLIVFFIVLISIIVIASLMFLLFGAGISFGFKFFDSLFSLLVQ